MRWSGSLACAVVVAGLGACGDDATSGSGGSSSTVTSVVSSGTGSTSTGAASDTWTNFAQGFVTTYCVECHAAGNPNRDYTTLDGVKVDAAEIRCGVSTIIESGCTGFPPPKQFPVDNAAHTNPKPSDADRARLIAWIDAGSPT